MASKILTIEIGEQITKVCEVAVGKKDLESIRSFMFQTPENAVRDGEILELEILSNVLQEQLTQHSISNKTVIFSLVSGKVVAREVILPPVKETRIKQIIHTNAVDYFPIDISKYYVTYSVLEKDMKGENPGYRILVYAAPLHILSGYFQLAESLQMQVKDIDYNGNASYRGLQNIDGDLVTMYVDIGYGMSMVTIMQGGQFMLQRTFSSGVEDILYAYMSVTERPQNEYLTVLEELSHQEGYQHVAEVLDEGEIHEGFGRLMSNMVRMIDFFNSNHWQTPIQKMVILGVGGQLYQVERLFANETELPVAHLDEIKGIYDEAPGVLAQYLSCLGASIAPVGFVPSEYVQKKKRQKVRIDASRSSVLFLKGACVLTGVLVFGSFGYHVILQSKLNKMKEQIESFQYVKDIAHTSEAYEKALADLKVLTDTIASPNEDLADFVKELEEKMPREITVLSATCTKETVDMNISVPSKVGAATVIKQLRTFDSLKSVRVGGFVHEESENAIGQVTFTVTCTYGENPYMAGKNPYAELENAQEEAENAETANAEAER